MANFVLDKGFLLPAASVAYARGELLVQTTTDPGGMSATRATAGTNVTVATNIMPYIVAMEDLDAVRALTGKVVLGCRVIGLARVKAGAAVTAGARIVPDATARGIPFAKTVGGTAPTVIAGIAWHAQPNVGQEFDMLVTVGMTW